MIELFDFSNRQMAYNQTWRWFNLKIDHKVLVPFNHCLKWLKVFTAKYCGTVVLRSTVIVSGTTILMQKKTNNENDFKMD